MEAGSDIAILEPAAYPARLPEAQHAMSCALNDWQANHWLDSHNNWHERWRGLDLRRDRGARAVGSLRSSAGPDIPTWRRS